jgi:hypothetical protein
MTTPLVHARTDGDLGEVVDQLHDWWFDLDDLRREAGSEQVSLTLYPTAREAKAKSALRRRLVIRGVSTVSVDDEARIGLYDLKTLTLRGDTLVLDSGFPLRVSFRLTGPPDVSVFEEGHP